jgi:hypothetical protein
VIFSLTLLALTAPPVPTGPLPTELWQVAPDRCEKCWEPAGKPPEKSRAVVLIPGLHVHPLRPSKAGVPERRPWEEPKAELVKVLAKDSDVFAFGYAQTVPVGDVADSIGLRDAVAKLRKAGYAEVVLVGHSAGGLIARQFAERNPDAGVAKVIAVGSPFAGAEAATFKVGYPKAQAPFVRSLTPESRAEVMKANPLVPGKDVQFACVVCKLKRAETDGLVFVRSQWPNDLQKAGVPAVLVNASHIDAMHNAEAVKAIAELARERLTRWSPEEVGKARKILFGEMQK